MKNEDQHIDKLFQALKADTFKAPPSFLDDLKLRMDAKVARKKKFMFWYSILGLAVLGIIGVVLFTQYSDMNSCETIALNERINIENNDLADSNSTTNVKPTVQQQFEHKRSIRFSSDQNSLTSNHSNSQNDSSDSGERNTNFNFKSSTSGSVSNKPKTAQKSTVGSTNNQFKQKNNTNSSKSNSKAPADKPIDGSISNTLPNVANPSSETNQKNNSFFDEGSITNINTSEENPIQKTTKSQDKVMRVSTLKLKTPTFVQSQFNIDKNANVLPTNPDFLTKSIVQNWEFDAQLYGGALLSYSRLDPIPAIADFKYSVPASAVFGLKANGIYKNSYASLGVEYGKTKDKISFTTKTLEQVGMDSTFFTEFFDTVWIDSVNYIVDSINYYQNYPIFDTVESKNTIRNTYSWLSIPISFGYRFKVNSWDIIPNIGMNFNFGVTSNSGEYPNSNGTKIKYEAVKFNMDVRIQTEIRKNFGNYYVFATPYFRKNLQPVISNPNLRINQSNWGLNVGAGIKF